MGGGQVNLLFEIRLIVLSNIMFNEGDGYNLSGTSGGGVMEVSK